MKYLQGMKLVAVLAVALSMGACANKNLGADAMASAATPGSSLPSSHSRNAPPALDT